MRFPSQRPAVGSTALQARGPQAATGMQVPGRAFSSRGLVFPIKKVPEGT